MKTKLERRLLLVSGKTFEAPHSSTVLVFVQRITAQDSNVANRCFELLKENQNHPSLHFKKVGDSWSVRVGLHYRALAQQDQGVYYWYWIGSHSEYDKKLND